MCSSQKSGFPCQIVNTLPAEGIIFAHRHSLSFDLRPKPKQLIICMKADYDYHPYAQLHIVQNQKEANTDAGNHFMPHWRQPGLMPRDSIRGDKFENIGYYGIEKNLTPEFKESKWSEQLEALGLRWHIVAEDTWNDYSQMDAIIAVRNFQFQESYKYKPASKLYNAWHARVPAVIGCDSAFRNERRSELDYLEVASVEDTIEALKRLRDNKVLREAMVKNGVERAEAFTCENLVIQWRNFITDVAIVAYHRWCDSSLQQKLYLAKQYLTVKESNLKPNLVYPHDQDTMNNDHIGVQDSAIVSTMQMYRKVRKLLSK